jgi:hypothetical protein
MDDAPRAPARVPAGVWWASAFFAVAGVLELALGLWELPQPVPFWPAWEALGRAILYWLMSWGLWRRLALCRSIALVHCLAVVVTYAVVVAMALARAPVHFPASVIIQSLYQVPSGVVLFAFLRKPSAAALFPRPLFGR